MRIPVVSILAFIAVLALAPAAARAEAPSQLYRLSPVSTTERGCFPPCECPGHQTVSTRGTLKLTPAGSDPLFTRYTVTEVNWITEIDGVLTHVTGSGTYRIGGEVALTHQLILDLSLGSAAPARFDSGLVAGGADFPKIKISISQHGMVCFDTVFHIDAGPVPVTEIKPYILTGGRLTQLCLPPCGCPTRADPLAGTFFLVPISASATPSPAGPEFAVVDASFRAVSPAATPPVTLRGSGVYLLDPLTDQHRMILDLAQPASAAPLHFDSGLDPLTSDFPRIDISLSVIGAVCTDTLLDLHALPAPAAHPVAATALPISLTTQPAPTELAR